MLHLLALTGGFTKASGGQQRTAEDERRTSGGQAEDEWRTVAANEKIRERGPLSSLKGESKI